MERVKNKEKENSQLSFDLEQSVANQKAMEESLVESQDIITAYENDKKELQDKLDSTTNDEEFDSLKQVLHSFFSI